MTYQQFYYSMLNLKEFIKEQDKLNAVIKVISPTSTGVVEFGNKFIDDYIRIVEDALNDPANWVSWFVFDNDFGKKKLKVVVNGKSFNICDEKQFYDVCLKM